MPYKACLFDLDGTLLNTLEDIADSMNRALQEAGLPTHPLDAYRYFVGNGVKILVERALSGHLEAFDQVEAAYRAYYSAGSHNKTRPYPGIEDILRALHRAGVPLCVLSNKPHGDTLQVMKEYFPDIPFAIVRGQIEGVAPKPDPAGALAIAEDMKFAPGDFLYSGDTAVDMTCAREAGMVPLGVTWGFRPRQELAEAGAAYIIDDPGEIVSLALGKR